MTKNSSTARPRHKPSRQRYSLRELLRNATPKTMRELARQTKWAREGNSVGRELTWVRKS